MKKPTRAETNPFPFSDTNRRFHTYDYFLKKRYGGKCIKIALDADMTCPNIDGKRGHGGCIYCSSSGSGNRLGGKLSLREQYDLVINVDGTNWKFMERGDGTHNMTSGAYAYGTIENYGTDESTNMSTDLVIATPYFVYNASTKMIYWTVDKLDTTELL